MEWVGSDNRAIAIIRVSSDKQTDNFSHETQQTEIDQYCEVNRLTLARSFRITESAKSANHRTEYDLALKFALKSKIRHVVFYMFDRETRNLTNAEQNEDLVRGDRIVLHYARDRKVLWSKSSSSDFMIRDYNAVSAKYQVRNMADKVADALVKKAESGHYPGARPPRGYKSERLRNERGTVLKAGTILVPDPDTAPWVCREFELRAQGLSFGEIRKRCLEENIVPARYVMTYFKSSVEYHIKDPIYFGRVRWRGIEYDGKHELIVPKRILDAVKALGSNRRGHRLYDPSYGIFGNGWLHCECGCQIVYDPKEKRNRKTDTVRIYHYYRCTNGKKAHETLAGRNVTEESLWEQLGYAVGRITITQSLANDVAHALNHTQEVARETTKRQMEAYRKRITELEKDEDTAYDHLRSKALDADSYRRQIERIRTQKRECIDFLERAQHSLTDACMETARTTFELAINAKSLWETRAPTERRFFLERILSNPIISGVTIRYELKKPFMILEKMGQSGEWLGD